MKYPQQQFFYWHITVVSLFVIIVVIGQIISKKGFDLFAINKKLDGGIVDPDKIGLNARNRLAPGHHHANDAVGLERTAKA